MKKNPNRFSYKSIVILFCMLSTLFLISGCQKTKEKHEIKIAASNVPHSELLEFIRPDLAAQGIDLKIIQTDDYNLPNRLLEDKEIDANFFQHIPFLELQSNEFGYDFVVLEKVHIEPLGLYSKKIKSLDELKEGSKIAIPNDPTNERRALLLLQSLDFIVLKPSHAFTDTILNIKLNPKNFKFLEVDAAMLPRILPDVDLAAIPTNYALEAGLNPLKDALALESKDSPYVNVVVVRKGEENRPELIMLKQLMSSQKMRDHILSTYKGALIPAFGNITESNSP